WAWEISPRCARRNDRMGSWTAQGIAWIAYVRETRHVIAYLLQVQPGAAVLDLDDGPQPADEVAVRLDGRVGPETVLEEGEGVGVAALGHEAVGLLLQLAGVVGGLRRRLVGRR